MLYCAIALSLALGLATAMPRRNPGPLHSRKLSTVSVAGTDSLIWSVLDFGANPNATTDSTDALAAALAAAANYSVPGTPWLHGTHDATRRAGLTLSLMGGTYLVSSPLFMPTGGFRLCCGSLLASPEFQGDFMLNANGGELLTIEDVTIDANHTTGGLFVNDVLRATLERIYVAHFATQGIKVAQGHEVHIGSSFLGEYWWGEPNREAGNYTGTAIEVDGQDHWISDVTIFAGMQGIHMRGGAALIEGAHIYNGGGPAIYLAATAGSNVQRILGSYLDGCGIVVEAPADAVTVTDSLFLQGTGVTVNVTYDGATVSGLEISNNIYHGAYRTGAANATLVIDTTLGQLGAGSKDIRVDRNSVENSEADRATHSTAHAYIGLEAGASGQTAHVPLKSAFPLPLAVFPPVITSASAILSGTPAPSALIGVQAIPLQVSETAATLLLQPVPASAQFPDNATVLVSATVEQLSPAPSQL